jgi:phenylacetate-CoA ligase
MEKITGRSDDMMIVRGVNVFPTQVEELICRRQELAPHYQCILTREGPLDELTVAVEVRAGIDPASDGAKTAAQNLAHEMKAYIGTTAHIELKPSGGIERSMGKARRVVDRRKL